MPVRLADRRRRWKTVSPDELTTDLMELDFFREIAWLKLGTQRLGAGQHTLEFRVSRFKNAKGEPQRMLYTCDAICITPDEFHPNSKFKPDEPGQDPADVEAGKTAFTVPAAKTVAERTEVALKGVWQICRDDEQLPGEVAAPVPAVPAKTVWKAIAVPGDKGELRHDMTYAHRVWYRTRVDVPDTLAGRSFYVEFPQNNLNSTIVVNGTFCGFNKNPFVRFSVDVTKAIKPGQANELCVGIKDAWYGYYNDPKDPMKLRRNWNLPVRFLGMGFANMVYPEWSRPQSGLLQTPLFVAAGGPAYAADVFVKPSVAQKRLAVEVSVENPSGGEVRGDVLCEAIDPASGDVAKALPPKSFTAAGGKQQVVEVAGEWADPKLWWPVEKPDLYLLRTTVRVDGKAVDSSAVSFGFREWTYDSKVFKLNGTVWHGWADCFTASNRKEWLDYYRSHNQRFYRFWAPNRFFDLSDQQALEFFDRNGVVVRRTGVLDGEAMGYNGEHVEELGRNWIDQTCAFIRGERNHPSIMIWSLENEISFINAINAGWIDRWEKVTAEAWKKIHEGQDGRSVDPTRPVMVDGGGAGKDQLLPVQGDHYITGDWVKYPALAYAANVTGGGRGRWTWDEKRPRFIGEDLFIAGNHPEFATFGGEAAFGGKAAALPAAGLMIRMAQQGYRWADYGAWHFWMGQSDADNSQYRFFAPRAALCRQWDWTFGSGQQVKRSIGLFNDTFDSTPMTFAWELKFPGREATGASKEYAVKAGSRQVVAINLTMPAVESRTEGKLLLRLSVDGKEVYRDSKAVSVFAVNNRSGSRPGGQLAAGDLVVVDPNGTLAEFLKRRAVAFTPLADLNKLPETGKVLLVGKDVISREDCTSSAPAAWAAAGRTVIVLEQKQPLKYQALPAEIEATTAEGSVAFGEDMTSACAGGPGAEGLLHLGRRRDRLSQRLCQTDTRGQESRAMRRVAGELGPDRGAGGQGVGAPVPTGGRREVGHQRGGPATVAQHAGLRRRV